MTKRHIANFTDNDTDTRPITDGTGYDTFGRALSYKDVIRKTPNWDVVTTLYRLYDLRKPYDIIKQPAAFNQDEYIKGYDKDNKYVDITRTTDRPLKDNAGNDLILFDNNNRLYGYAETITQKSNPGSQ